MSGRVQRALAGVFPQWRKAHRQVHDPTPEFGHSPGGDALHAHCAAALAAHAADLAAPVAEFGCGQGVCGTALARAGFTCIDGFDPSEENLAKAKRSAAYRRLARADLSRLEDIPTGVYANAAAVGALDPARLSPQVLDGLLTLLPPGGCLVFSLPGGGASVGRFRTRVLELCEHFVAEPVFRGYAPASRDPGLQSTVYVLKKR